LDSFKNSTEVFNNPFLFCHINSCLLGFVNTASAFFVRQMLIHMQYKLYSLRCRREIS